MQKEIELVAVKSRDDQLYEYEFVEAPESYFNKIVVQDVLEVSQTPNIIDIVASKVRKGGTLILEGIDAFDICRRICNGSLSLSEASKQFFNKANSLNSIVTLKDFFLKKEWKIRFAGLNNGRYMIEVIR